MKQFLQNEKTSLEHNGQILSFTQEPMVQTSAPVNEAIKTVEGTPIYILDWVKNLCEPQLTAAKTVGGVAFTPQANGSVKTASIVATADIDIDLFMFTVPTGESCMVVGTATTTAFNTTTNFLNIKKVGDISPTQLPIGGKSVGAGQYIISFHCNKGVNPNKTISLMVNVGAKAYKYLPPNGYVITAKDKTGTKTSTVNVTNTTQAPVMGLTAYDDTTTISTPGDGPVEVMHCTSGGTLYDVLAQRIRVLESK